MTTANNSTPKRDSDNDPETPVSGVAGQDIPIQTGDRDGGARRAGFPDLEADPAEGHDRELDLDLVLDVPVTMTMEVGGVRLSVRNLLNLRRGSLVELDRLAGEPMDVKVNGVLVAYGEVVVVNEKFGIRLTNVIRPTEWIRKLK